MAIEKWSDRLFPASFRDVPFFTHGTSTTVGRTGSDHEFINRNVPYAEDTGRRQRKFKVTGFLVGGGESFKKDLDSGAQRVTNTEHYFETRDRLTAAAEAKGPGTLRHPYYGVIEVVCRGMTIVESAEKGRGCEVSFSFVEAGSIDVVDDKPLAAEQVKKLGEQLDAAVNEVVKVSLNAEAKVAGKYGSITDAGRVSLINTIKAGAASVASKIAKVQAGIQAVKDAKNNIVNTIQKFNTIIAQVANGIKSIGSLASDIMRLPGELSKQFKDNIDQLKNAGADTASAYKQLFSGTGFGEDLDDDTTTLPSRVQESKNNKIVRMMYRSMSATAAMDFAVDIDFASRADAEKVRDSIIGVLDELIDEVSDDLANPLADDLGIESPQSIFTAGMFDLLQSLRAQIALALPGDLEDDVIAEVTVKEYECALATAYRVTGNVASYDDIVVRNNLSHPAVIEPETTLKVLIDV